MKIGYYSKRIYQVRRGKSNVWRARLRAVYSSRDEWMNYSDTYGIANRLGDNAKNLWKQNPVVEAGTTPGLYRIVK